MDIRGVYKHFKGKNYEVMGEAFEPSTKINYVFYKQLYSPFEFWIRPKEMFFDKKNVDGNMISRFVKVSDTPQNNLKDIDVRNIKVNHSETKEIYKIIDIKDGYFFIDLVD